MSLKVLCAGCSQEERERAESDVRRAMGKRLEGDQWTVSLVKVAGRWSVTLARPAAATVNCVAPEGRLAESILQALGDGPPVAPASAAAASSPSSAARPSSSAAAAGGRVTHRSRHHCGSCQGAFVVVCEAGADEGEETAAVACPHCWHRNYVLIPESAAETREFTAEKAES